MMKFKILIPEGILVIEPDHALKASDFSALSRDVDDFADAAELIVSQFIHAEVKHFQHANYEQALSWLEKYKS